MNGLQEPGGGGMERRAIMATVLALIVLLVYQTYFAPTPLPPTEPERAEVEETAAPAVPEAALPSAVPKALPPAAKASRRKAEPLRRGKREEEIVLETDLLKVTLTNRGGGVRSWQLKKYEEPTGLVDLVGPIPDGGTPLSLTAWLRGGEGAKGLYRILERPTDDRSKPQRVVMEFQEASGTVLEKTVVLYPGRYLADVTIRVKNLGAGTAQDSLQLQWGPAFSLGGETPNSIAASPVAWIEGSLVSPNMEEVEEELTQPGTATWTALQDKYFAVVLIPDEPKTSSLVAKDAEDRPIVGLLYPAKKIPAGREATTELKLYAGPKEITRLRDAGHELRELISLGWFDFLARPALYFLRFLNDFVNNYGVAIIIITVLQKAIFYPLTQKSHKSMQAMQTLQPRIQAIKDKHKNNPKKVNEETMELYKRHGVNPLGGCLPMIIQIPIFIALYNAFASSVELWHAPFTLWITDLSSPDTLFALPFAIPYLGEGFPMRGLPLVMGISMFIQQKMSPTGGDPRQAKMMLYLMPVMFTFIFWGMPSGLVLYWLVNNILQIGHQYHMNQGFSLPVVAGKEAG
ncbi:MAG: membrane protein insertase YidC [candidate division NC10 bacterium]